MTLFPGTTQTSLHLLAVLMATAAFGMPSAHAQTSTACGRACGSCLVGGAWKEGKDLVKPGDTGAIYDMDCYFKGWFWDCNKCKTGQEGRALAADLPQPNESIIASIVAASPAELRHVVQSARDQIFVDLTRNIIAFRGAGCAANTIATVIVASPAKVRRLREMGIPLAGRG